ncbi:MAG: hypothetical protein U0414_11085 [Polyangiaceae bacterium]
MKNLALALSVLLALLIAPAAWAYEFVGPKEDFKVEVPPRSGEHVCFLTPGLVVDPHACEGVDVDQVRSGMTPPNTKKIGWAILATEEHALAMQIAFESLDRTATRADIDDITSGVERALRSEFGAATLRSKTVREVNGFTVIDLDTDIQIHLPGGTLDRVRTAYVPVRGGAYALILVGERSDPRFDALFEDSLATLSMKPFRMDESEFSALSKFLVPGLIGWAIVTAIVAAVVLVRRRNRLAHAQQAGAYAPPGAPFQPFVPAPQPPRDPSSFAPPPGWRPPGA